MHEPRRSPKWNPMAQPIVNQIPCISSSWNQTTMVIKCNSFFCAAASMWANAFLHSGIVCVVCFCCVSTWGLSYTQSEYTRTHIQFACRRLRSFLLLLLCCISRLSNKAQPISQKYAMQIYATMVPAVIKRFSLYGWYGVS